MESNPGKASEPQLEVLPPLISGDVVNHAGDVHWNVCCHGIPKPLKSQTPSNKNDLFPKKSNFWKSAISKTCAKCTNVPLKSWWISWMRHLWHFDRIQPTSLFYLYIARHVSSIAAIEFEAMSHAKEASKKTTYISRFCQDPKKTVKKSIFVGWFFVTGFHD